MKRILLGDSNTISGTTIFHHDGKMEQKGSRQSYISAEARLVRANGRLKRTWNVKNGVLAETTLKNEEGKSEDPIPHEWEADHAGGL